MIQKDGFNCRLEYATISINNKSFIAKEPIEYPFFKIFFDETDSKNGKLQNKIHFRFKDIDGNLIQVVAYFDKNSAEFKEFWNKQVPMQRNLNLLNRENPIKNDNSENQSQRRDL